MSLPDTSVVYFSSAMSGAPVLSGTAGTLIAVLDACLVNGFGTVTVNSLAVASNVATLVVSTGHNLAMIGSTGPVIEIAGATPAALNGRWRVASVPNSTTLTFATEGIADQTATGTITVKRASARWAKAFSGTNKAAYARGVLGATQMLLQVLDNAPGAYGAREARLRGFESMTDVDTGSGPFPTAAQLSAGIVARKSSTLDATSRPWYVAADGASVLVVPLYHASYAYGDMLLFGDLAAPKKAADAFHCLIRGPFAESSAGAHPNNSSYTKIDLGSFDATLSGQYVARAYTQIGGSVASGWSGENAVSLYFGGGGYAYPNPIDNGLCLAPITISESSVDRGCMAGCFQPLHLTPGAAASTVEAVDGETTRTLVLLPVAATHNAIREGRLAVDLTGPWR